MNYLKVYCNLIRKAENRDAPEGYVEKHHTFPKSIFGKNSRVVLLTAREHYIAHALLQKIYLKRYGIYDHRSHKMIKAHILMKTRDYFNSYLYESARKKLSKSQSGKGNHNYGKILTKDHKEKISNSLKGEKNPNYKKVLSEETKLKISKSKKGKKRNEDVIEKLSKEFHLLGPNNEIITGVNIRKFCRENNLNQGALCALLKGKLKSHKGYRKLIYK
jgi:hypothetical protein